MALRRGEGASPRRAGARETTDRVISAAEALIAEHGEHGLRIEDVAERSNVSVGSIYYHFEDREGLVRAVLQRQVVTVWGAQLFELFDPGPALETATSAEEFADGYMGAMRAMHSEGLAAMRLIAAEMLGSSLSREEVIPRLREQVTAVLDALTEQCAPLEERGYLRPGVSPRGFILFIRSLSAGQIIVDLDAHPFDEEEWVMIVEGAVRSMLNIEARPAATAPRIAHED